jgi:hypothetical protein
MLLKSPSSCLAFAAASRVIAVHKPLLADGSREPGSEMAGHGGD